MSRQVEEWQDIPGYDGHYQISDWGRVRTMKHGQHTLKEPKILKIDVDRPAHKARVVLGGRDTHQVPRLVWQIFNGPVPEWMVVFPKDGDIGNTALYNLAIGSKAERCRDRAIKIGGPNRRPVLKIDLTLEVVRAYRSAREAARLNHFRDKSMLTRQLNLQVKCSVIAPDGYIYAWDDERHLRRTLARARAELDALGIRYNDPCTEEYYNLPPEPDFGPNPDIVWNEAPVCGGAPIWKQPDFDRSVTA